MSYQIVVIGTADQYWMLPMFARQFKKWWPGEPLVLYGDRQIDYPGVTFRRCPLHPTWSWDRWFCDGLRDILNELYPTVIGLFTLDRWISGPVDVYGVLDFATYIDRKGSVLRGDLGLSNGPRLASYRSIEIVGTSTVHPFSPALWNRNLLRDALEPSWGLKDAELGINSRIVSYPNLSSVGTLSNIVPTVKVIDVDKSIDLSGLPNEDAMVLVDMLPVEAPLKGALWT